jgi:uncharacterized membrane protein
MASLTVWKFGTPFGADDALERLKALQDSSDAVLDRVEEEFKATDAELISTNLSAEQEQRLRMAFESED